MLFIGPLLLLFYLSTVKDADARVGPRRRLAPNSIQPRSDTAIILTNHDNLQYTLVATVGGVLFPAVMFDTGSSDLWITGPSISNVTNLGRNVSIEYSIGSAAGSVNAASVTVGAYAVSNQAFMAVPKGYANGFGGIDGILGVGPSSNSFIRHSVGDSSGDSFLDCFFRQNPATPRFISFLLGRNGYAGAEVKGYLTIGENLPGFEAISNQPKVAVKHSPSDQHWLGEIDGIIGPDGQNINSFGKVAGGKLIASFDSGYSYSQVPRFVSDAIYSRVRGAQYDNAANIWSVPCDQELNVTVTIAREKYPIHPLDTSIKGMNQNGTTVCVGTFQPISSVIKGPMNAIMGMAFLRNVYISINIGDFLDGSPAKIDPYLQLLSVTETISAHREFVKFRMNGVDSTGDPAYALRPPDHVSNRSQPIQTWRAFIVIGLLICFCIFEASC